MSTVRYNYRLRPSAVAEQALIQEGHRQRWVWNECVHRFRSQQGSKGLEKLLSRARSEMAWLREGASMPQQQTIRDYRKALSRSFKVAGAGRPKPKPRRNYRTSLNYTSRGFHFERPDKSGVMPVLAVRMGIRMPIVMSRDMPSYPSSVRVYQDNLGHWYASFVVEVEDKILPPSRREGVGIDWGIKTPVATTDPECDEDFKGFALKAQKRLAHYQRQKDRREPKKGQQGSRRYRKSTKQMRKTYKKVARQRKDNAVKWANKVVAKHDLIAVEDLSLSFIQKNRSLARKANDIGLGLYRSELKSRGKRAGRRVEIVNPRYTTMSCSQCLRRANSPLGLGERKFHCSDPDCGYWNDRDTNAAWCVLRRAQGYEVGLYLVGDEGR